MQRSGFEWAFRLATDPRRLWRRYVVDNTWFLLAIALQLSGLRRRPLIART
jgi:N-acetylglucosaminyldiphosphoundecaprenol N-acetyl-beta-D-mannosaminyltransferase